MVLAPLVAVMLLEALPCNVNDCPVAPIVIALLGVIALVLTAAKVGLELIAMFWIVLITPPLALKLVALNWAMPFCVVEASSMVMVLPAAEALAMVSAPVRPFKLSTAAWPPPPPPLVTHVGHDILPLASIASGPEAETASVPVAFGTVIVLLEPVGVAKVKVFVMPPEVAARLTAAPCIVRFWLVAPKVKAAVGEIVFTANVPPMVTTVPLSVMIESPIVWVPVNRAKAPTVPPEVVTPPPTPAQLPAVVQMS